MGVCRYMVYAYLHSYVILRFTTTVTKTTVILTALVSNLTNSIKIHNFIFKSILPSAMNYEKFFFICRSNPTSLILPLNNKVSKICQQKCIKDHLTPATQGKLFWMNDIHFTNLLPVFTTIFKCQRNILKLLHSQSM